MICFLDEVDLLTSLSLDSFLIIIGSFEDDMIFAAWYVGVFGGGSGRVSEGEGEGVFLRKLSEDLSFCVAASLEGIRFKVDGNRNGGVSGFLGGREVGEGSEFWNASGRDVEGDGGVDVFLRTFSRDIYFSVAASFKGMGFKFDGDGCVVCVVGF